MISGKSTASNGILKTAGTMVSTTIFLEVENMPGRPKLTGKDAPLIGDHLARLRKEQQITQAELAEKIGITQAAVSDYERGVSSLNAPMLLRISKVLGVSADEVLGIKNGNGRKNPARLSRRILRRAEKIESLPARDQQAILRTIDAFISSQG